jgi:rod shape-determining protein MreC
MAYAGGLTNQSARDSAPGPRFFFFAVLSIVLMYFDQRDGWGGRIRYVLQAAAYPIQVAVGSPRQLWNATTELFETRDSLRRENARLAQRERELALATMRFDALEQENARLRALTGSLPPLVKKSQLADVVSVDYGKQRQRLVIDKGDSAGLYRSQPVVDAAGLVGQIVRLGPWSAEVMLITDPGHAVPVEILRNGTRSIAVGNGNESELELPLLPATADVKVGDVIVTSGLGGVFPAGLPVGTVTESKRDPDEILLQVRVKPHAALTQDHQVMALWFDPDHPAAPVNPALTRDLPDAPLAQPVLKPPGGAAPAPARPAPAKPAAPRPEPARPAATGGAPAAPAPAAPANAAAPAVPATAAPVPVPADADTDPR